MKNMYNLLDPSYKIKCKNRIKFELISWFGRKFLNKHQKKENKIKLLDLGVGGNYTSGWINADFFKLPRYKFWEKYKDHINPDWMLDLRYPLNCDNNVWDGVYTGHTLEHLYPFEVFNLLMEIYRTLKPGAWLRINLPDLEKFVKYYNKEYFGEHFKIYNSGCEAFHSLTQNWGHLSVWDKHQITKYLENIGFTNINEVEFGKGTDIRLIKDEEVRKTASFYIEAQKPEILK